MSFLTWMLLLVGATWLLTPEDVVRQLRIETPAVLIALEHTATAAATADPLTAPIRWALRHPPVRARAAAVLERAHATVNRELAAAAAGGPATPQGTTSAGLEPAVEAMAGAIARAIARSFGAKTPDTAPGRDTPEAWQRIDVILEALKEARQRISALALWQLFYLLIETGLALGVSVAAGAWRPAVARRARGVPPMPLARPASRLSALAGAVEARLHPDLGPCGRFLRSQGLPRTLAFDVDRSFRRHARWPGSLRGHDAVPGGLVRHSLTVGRLMVGKTQGHAVPTRQAAAFLGIIHDLGKTVTYQPTETGWTGHPASPHDSLSARIVGQCHAFRRAFPDALRRAILQALRDYHSSEVFASNASPIAKQLLGWLQEADTEAIARAAHAAREAHPP